MSTRRLFLLDTNITGYIVSGRSSRARRLLDEALVDCSAVISSVTEAEVLYGLEIRPEAVRLRMAVEKLFRVIEIRPWDSAAAKAYSRLRAGLRMAGLVLSHPDLMIAAHALALDAMLISHDRAFKNAVPYLAISDWATDI